MVPFNNLIEVVMNNMLYYQKQTVKYMGVYVCVKCPMNHNYNEFWQNIHIQVVKCLSINWLTPVRK